MTHHLFFDNLNKLLPNFDSIIKQNIIQNEGYFFVGGSIRDLLLGIDKSLIDIDITSPYSHELIRSRIDHAISGIFRTEKYGTITIAQKDCKYEITPHRIESGYGDKRHPDQIQRSNNLRDDAQRRDFTINALYWTWFDISHHGKHTQTKQSGREFKDNTFIVSSKDIYDLIQVDGVIKQEKIYQLIKDFDLQIDGLHLLIDPTGGLSDLESGTLRAVGNPDIRFNEDALRLLRALRFINTFNQQQHLSFDFDSTTRRSIKKHYFLIQRLAKERIREEVLKVFMLDDPFGYVALLDETNMLKFIFPAVAATKGVTQYVRYHPLDTYHHTIMVLYHCQQLTKDPLLKLAALYHDVGKVEQYHAYTLGLTKDEMGRLHGSWLNHSICGADMTTKDFTTLGFSNKEIQTISWYVLEHMTPGQILMAKEENQVKKLRKMLSESDYEMLYNVIILCKADRFGQYNPIQNKSDLVGPDLLLTQLDSLMNSEGQFTLKQLAVDGSILMQDLGLEPGRKIGEILKKLHEWAMSDIESRNTKDKLIHFAKKNLI